MTLNTLDDGVTGTTSHAVDLPNGGVPARGQSVPESPGLAISLVGLAPLTVVRPRGPGKRLVA